MKSAQSHPSFSPRYEQGNRQALKQCSIRVPPAGYDRGMTAVPSVAISVQPVTPALMDARLAAAVRALQVSPEQRDYVGDVAFNLADAQRDPLSEAMAVLADAAVIGFYRLDFAPCAVTGRAMGVPSVAVRAFLIDQVSQGQGYGSRAVRALCADLQQRHRERKLVILLVNCRNHAAQAVYRNAGFIATGEFFAGGRAGAQSLMIRSLAIHGLSIDGLSIKNRDPSCVGQ